MKKTAELPVAESVKLCIELDEETLKQWEQTKKCLKWHFKTFYKHPVRITDSIAFQCLLYCYTYDEGIPTSFTHSHKGDLEIE